jgi:hypothetical protein
MEGSNVTGRMLDSDRPEECRVFRLDGAVHEWYGDDPYPEWTETAENRGCSSASTRLWRGRLSTPHSLTLWWYERILVDVSRCLGSGLMLRGHIGYLT